MGTMPSNAPKAVLAGLQQKSQYMRERNPPSLPFSPKDDIHKEAGWTISNTTADSPQSTHAADDANIIAPLINIRQNADFKTKKQAGISKDSPDRMDSGILTAEHDVKGAVAGGRSNIVGLTRYHESGGMISANRIWGKTRDATTDSAESWPPALDRVRVRRIQPAGHRVLYPSKLFVPLASRAWR